MNDGPVAKDRAPEVWRMKQSEAMHSGTGSEIHCPRTLGFALRTSPTIRQRFSILASEE